MGANGWLAKLGQDVAAKINTVGEVSKAIGSNHQVPKPAPKKAASPGQPARASDIPAGTFGYATPEEYPDFPHRKGMDLLHYINAVSEWIARHPEAYIEGTSKKIMINQPRAQGFKALRMVPTTPDTPATSPIDRQVYVDHPAWIRQPNEGFATWFLRCVSSGQGPPTPAVIADQFGKEIEKGTVRTGPEQSYWDQVKGNLDPSNPHSPFNQDQMNHAFREARRYLGEKFPFLDPFLNWDWLWYVLYGGVAIGALVLVKEVKDIL